MSATISPVLDQASEPAMGSDFEYSEEAPQSADSFCSEEVANLLADSVFHPGVSERSPAADSETVGMDMKCLGLIDRFRLISVLGTGGMGVVFRAVDPHADCVVCIKLMSDSLVNHRSSRLRFEREASMMRLVRHHNVVQFLDQGKIRLQSGAELPWMAMSLAPGRPLDTLLKRDGRFAENRILWIAKELARGLCGIHEAGIVHRDLKPSNLMVDDEQKRLTIIDFGLARPMRNATMITRSDQLLGTPTFMSPEQFKGAPLDQRTDLYSLGVILYTLAAGIPPFVENDWTVLRNRVMTGTAEPIDLIRPDLSEGIRRLVHTLLEKNPARRLGSAVAVLQLLESIEPRSSGTPVDPSAWSHVILADDDKAFGDAAIHRMSRKGVSMRLALTPFDLFRMISETPTPDAVLVDMAYGEHDGMDVVRQLREEKPGLPVLVLTSARSIDKAVAAMKLGCRDFICKPFDDDNLAQIIRDTIVPPSPPGS
jgi:serine/threonine protein kinase